MSDHMSPEQRSRAMKRVKLKDGPLEELVQRELMSRGLRFKRHVRTLPGSPDIVFPADKLAVFVDGRNSGTAGDFRRGSTNCPTSGATNSERTARATSATSVVSAHWVGA
jgi:DNA mismatch endonuclease Vsr